MASFAASFVPLEAFRKLFTQKGEESERTMERKMEGFELNQGSANAQKEDLQGDYAWLGRTKIR